MGPYPGLDPLQQKRLAARRHATTYCYDFPSVFNTALRDIWAARTAAGEPGAQATGTQLFHCHPETLHGVAMHLQGAPLPMLLAMLL